METSEIRDSNSGKKVLSVIITAHNRKKYILEAVKSVLGQSLENKQELEIIVVKDFKDNSIDSFLAENSVVNLYREGGLGEMLYEGIMKSSGPLISFLDDDDMFFNDKLRTIRSLFDKYPGSVFISNRYKSMSENSSIGQTANFNGQEEIHKTSTLTAKGVVRLINDKIDFNLSSISIRRNLALHSLKQLKELKGGPDTFFFLNALDISSDFIRTNTQLTSYRVRPISDSTTMFLKNDHSIMEERAAFMCEMIKPFTESSNNLCKEVAQYLYEDWRVTEQLVNQSPSRRRFLNLLVHRPRLIGLTFSSYYIMKSFLILIYLLSPRIGFSFYRVLKNNQSRNILN